MLTAATLMFESMLVKYSGAAITELLALVCAEEASGGDLCFPFLRASKSRWTSSSFSKTSAVDRFNFESASFRSFTFIDLISACNNVSPSVCSTSELTVTEMREYNLGLEITWTGIVAMSIVLDKKEAQNGIQAVTVQQKMNPRAFVDSIVLRRMYRGLQWLYALFCRCSVTTERGNEKEVVVVCIKNSELLSRFYM